MSRGHGSVQRAILDALDRIADDEVLLIGGGWPSGRRAAHRLAEDRLVTLRMVNAHGRKMLTVRKV